MGLGSSVLGEQDCHRGPYHEDFSGKYSTPSPGASSSFPA